MIKLPLSLKYPNMFSISKIIPKHIIVNFKNAIFYFSPSILTLIINLYTTPIFAKNLSHLDYSIIGYFGAIQSFFLPVLNLSLFPYYMKVFHNRTEVENEEIISSITIFLTITNLFTIAIGALLVYIYFKLTNVTFPFSPYIFLILFASYFSIYLSSLKMKYKMQKKGLKFAAISGVFSILNISLGLFFVVILKMGAKGNIGAMFLTQAIVGIFSFVFLIKNIAINFSIIKEAIKLGYPIIIASLLDLPILYIDKILLEQQNNVIEFGLYNVGMIFSGYLLTMSAAIFQAFEPDFYRFTQKKKHKQLGVIVLTVFGIMLISNIIFSFFSEHIVSFLTGNRYTDAYRFSNVFIWSDYFLQVSYLLSIYFIVEGKTKIFIYQKIILAVISLIVYPLAISKWGFTGAAFSRVVISISNCIIFAFLIIVSKRYEKPIIC